MFCAKLAVLCAIFAGKKEVIPLLKIAVCDDKYEHLKKISNMLERYFQAHSHASAKVEIFLSGAALLNRVEEAGGFDLYILDILMPEQSGIDIGRRLRKLGAWGELIFLSHSNDYAADSYDLRAFFYLLKPVEEGKLFRVLDQAMEKAGQKKQQAIVVETREGPRRILLEKILYCERAGRVMRCHCTDGMVDSQTLRGSFHHAVAPLLADSRFYLCGASFVLNFQHVAGVNGQTALLDNGETVSLPRSAAMDFKRAWGKYWLT